MPQNSWCLWSKIIWKASLVHFKSFFSWKVDFLSLFKKRPNINLYVEYSWMYCQFFKDSKFAYKTTKILHKMTCAQLWTKTLTSISRKICFVKSGYQILCVVEEFSSLFSRLFSLMQSNWVQTIFHKDTGCLCHWEKTIMPGKLLCLSRQIIQKASSAHHNFFLLKSRLPKL